MTTVGEWVIFRNSHVCKVIDERQDIDNENILLSFPHLAVQIWAEGRDVDGVEI